MENARTKKSRDRNRINTDTDADVTGNAVADGGSVRTDDGNEQTIGGESRSAGIGTLSNERITSEPGIGHTRNQIEAGYYCTPDGTIRSIPEGYFVDARDGRLRKRRQRRSDTNNADDGNESNSREQTGDNETEFFTSAGIRKPLTVRGRRKQRTVKEDSKKQTMVTLLAAGCSALFTSVALLTKHEHWQLSSDSVPSEAKILAEALNDAINTLPTKYYEQITSIVEKWFPWINLAFVISALVIERVERSVAIYEQAEKARYVPRERSDAGNAVGGTQASSIGNNASIGYGQ